MRMSGFTRALAVLASAATLGAPAALAQTPPPGEVTGGAIQGLDLWSAAGRETGLDSDLWRGTSAELAETVLGPLADQRLSVAEAALARRILATAGRSPEGAPPTLAALRSLTLIGLGDLEAAAEIGRRTPRLEVQPAIARTAAESALWLGDDARACALGDTVQDRADLFWLRLRAYCELVSGNERAAQVSFGLWRESGDEADGFARLLSQALLGEGEGPADASDGLGWALSRRLELDLPAPAASRRPVIAARGADGEDLAAVSRALRLGLVDVGTVRAAYLARALPPGPSAPAEALSPDALADPAPTPLPEVPEGVVGEANLYRVAHETRDADLRRRALVALLGEAESAEAFVALSRLAAPELVALAREVPAGADPALLAQAAAVAGEPEAARALFSRAVRTEGGWDATRFALMEAIVAASDARQGGSTLDRLVERGAAGSAPAQGAALILSALGARMTPEARAQFATFDVPRPRTTPARLTALALAGQDGHAGETALLALSIVRQQPDGITLADRAAIVSALRQAGLEEDARAIAMEGLLALARP
ncbi:hypothetical protein [Brevundimonas sp.]|uniref:hypothetical protein n=1 Tax=Brevundimonas sp. TaxID=1871086 RepID=UPI0025E17FB9|nr:hypothetical protein [Brevundimonas sp.]